MKNLSVIAVIGAALVATPAQAAGCWSDATYEAAQMRDFDTMLMVFVLCLLGQTRRQLFWVITAQSNCMQVMKSSSHKAQNC